MSLSAPVVAQAQTAAAAATISATPSGIDAGDLLVACIMPFQSLSPADVTTTPTGWSAVAQPYPTSGSYLGVLYAYKVATAADIGAEVTFGFDGDYDVTMTIVGVRSSLSGHVANIVQAWSLAQVIAASLGSPGVCYQGGTTAAVVQFGGRVTTAPAGPVKNFNNGSDFTEIATQAAGTDASCLLQDVEGQFLSQAEAVAGGWPGGGGAIDSWLVLWLTETTAAPLAPTGLAPTAGSYLDATETIAFSGTYNPTNGQPMNALRLSYQQTGGTTYYWTGTAWSTTQTWVAASASPGGQFSISPTAGATHGPTNGTSGSYTVACQESGADAQGAACSPILINFNAVPVVDVIGPTGTIVLPQPTINWTFTGSGGATQAQYRVCVYGSAQYGIAGFTPGTSPSTYDSGTVNGSSTSDTAAANLQSDSYRAYVQVTDSNGETSAWEYVAFTLTVQEPMPPLFTAVEEQDPTTGAPQVAITATGQDNLLDADTAGFNTSVGTWTASGTASPTLELEPGVALSGANSCAVPAAAPGTVILNTAETAITPNETVTATVAVYGATFSGTVTFKIVWFNSSGAPVGTPATVTFSATTSAWTTHTVTATPPGSATEAALGMTWTAPASSTAQIYIDQAGLYEAAAAPTWSAGGFAGDSTVEVQSSPDGENWTDVYGMGAVALPSPSQAVTGLIDRTAPPNADVYYRARVNAVAGSYTYTSVWTDAIGPLVPDAQFMWWLQIPGEPDSAVGFNLAQDTQRKVKEIGTIDYPLGRSHGVKMSDGTKGLPASLPIQMNSITGAGGLTALRALMQYSGVLLLQDPVGVQQYVTHDPATDITEANNFKTYGTDSPYSTVTFTFIEVDGPTG